MTANRYGHFAAQGREFVITDPRTPRPWFNYLSNGHYTALISHTGGGFSFLDCPRDNRLSRMRYNSLPWDRPGRYVYVKEVATGEYWSLSWAPTIHLDYDAYACHQGQGYTRILTRRRDLEATITYFVPRDANAEIWWVTLKNLGTETKQYELYAFHEILMGNALNDLINQPNDQHFPAVWFDREQETLVATRRYWVLNQKVSVAQPNRGWEYQLLFGSTLPVTGFDGSLGEFIGRWRSEANPLAIERGVMGNSEITAGDPALALQSNVTLAPGEELPWAVVQAIAPNSPTPNPPQQTQDPFQAVNWSQMRDLDWIQSQWDAVRQYWDHYLGACTVHTPLPELDQSLNIWNPYQAAVTFEMARNAGFYHGGLLFGTGMRDQFQDILGRVLVAPAEVRARLEQALTYQFADGSTLHNFFRLTGAGEKTGHSDTPLWIPFGLVEYLRETGDWEFLAVEVPFYDGGQGTVYEHVGRALDWAIANCSDRGLPKIQKGDWNDTLDHIGPLGKGEKRFGGQDFWATCSNTCDPSWLSKRIRPASTVAKRLMTS